MVKHSEKDQPNISPSDLWEKTDLSEEEPAHWELIILRSG